MLATIFHRASDAIAWVFTNQTFLIFQETFLQPKKCLYSSSNRPFFFSLQFWTDSRDYNLVTIGIFLQTSIASRRQSKCKYWTKIRFVHDCVCFSTCLLCRCTRRSSYPPNCYLSWWCMPCFYPVAFPALTSSGSSGRWSRLSWRPRTHSQITAPCHYHDWLPIPNSHPP